MGGTIENNISDDPANDCSVDLLRITKEASGDETQGVDDELPFCEAMGSPNETFVTDGSVVKRTFYVGYCDRQTFMRQMVGYPYLEGAEMRRKLPETVPEWVNTDGQRFLFATRVDFKGLGYRHQSPAYDEPTNYYELTEATVTYETLPYDVSFLADIASSPKELSRFVRKLTSNSGEFLTAEWGGWRWIGSGNAQIDGKQAMGSRIGIWQGLQRITYTWFDVHPSGWNQSRAEGMIGKINDATFDGYGASKLLLIGVNYVPKRAASGIRTLEITFDMLHKPQGHNKYLHPIGQYYEVAAAGDNTKKPLQSTTFSNLFIP